jgi:hypothetical protein
MEGAHGGKTSRTHAFCYGIRNADLCLFWN